MNQEERNQLESEARSFESGAGFIRMNRTILRLTGEDRRQFLHNLCTNDIVGLEPGAGCEAFLCNVQGKTLGFVLVYCGEDDLLLESEPNQGETLVHHLDKYLITEDVKITDVSDQFAVVALCGDASRGYVRDHITKTPPGNYLDHTQVELGGCSVSLSLTDLLSKGTYCLRCGAQDVESLSDVLQSAGMVRLGSGLAEAIRIASGFPRYGEDITDTNLPQEVGRDRLAISFTKGCYLGQETVARIDAMGHVNWHLVRLKLNGDVAPAVDAQLSVEGKACGRITSSAWSPLDQSTRALAYVRREVVESNDCLDVGNGHAEIIQ